MSEEAKRQCDYLIIGLQLDFSINRPEKKGSSQSIIERYIQLKGSKHIDELCVRSFKLSVRIIGNECDENSFTGITYCEEKGIELYYNARDHRFSMSVLRKQVKQIEDK
jgi:glycerol-3-phosphate cytidylyltransferase